MEHSLPSIRQNWNQIIFSLFVIGCFTSTAYAAQTSVTFQQGLSGYTAVTDTYIRTDNWGTPPRSTLNYGQSSELITDVDSSKNVLLRFDLSSIPANSDILSATLSLYNRTNSGGKQRTIQVHQVLQGWHAGNQDHAAISAPGEQGATGQYAFDYYTGEGSDILWNSIGMEAGTDFDTLVGIQAQVSDVGWVNWDVTAFVTNWTQGQPNHGLTLRDPDGWESKNTKRQFHSSEYPGDINRRPKLTVTYTHTPENGLVTLPPAYYPDGAHPRLWLTQERLGALQQARQQQTPEWLVFKSLSDRISDSDPNNDPWYIASSPHQATAPLALMYRLTGDAQYADRALELMDQTTTVISAPSDKDNFHFLGLAYDWLYDYPGMTEAKKLAYQQKIIDISNGFWVIRNGQGTDSSNEDTDRNLNTGMVHLTLGAAIFGDHAGSLALLDRGWSGWIKGYGHNGGPPKYSNLDYVGISLGGAFPTGFAYFSGTESVGISGYQMTLDTALRYDVYNKHPEIKPFWGNIIRSIIHLTDPSRETIYHTGDWQDSNALDSQNWLYRVLSLATYFSDQAGDSVMAARGRGYAQINNLGNHSSGWFDEFFFTTPSGTVKNPYQDNLPLTYFADNPDYLMFRDDWSQNANWGLFIGDGSYPLDHQNPDHGSFALWRGNDFLTKGVRTYDGLANGDFFNSLSIENGCQFGQVLCSGTAIRASQAPAIIARHRTKSATPQFAYAMLQADGQWNEDPDSYEPLLPVQTYRRHFFWSGEYTIIFDRLRMHYDNAVKYRIRALAQPSVSGNTVTQLSENGQQKLLHRTLEPAGVQPQVVNETNLWQSLPQWKVNQSERRWQSVISMSPVSSVNLLNVLQTGPASLADFDSIEHISSTDQSGVRIGDWVVVFSSNELLRDHVQYTIYNTPSGLNHLVADLKAGVYNVRINGASNQQYTVSSQDNTLYFTNLDAATTLIIEISP